jgi:hypothetical protein
VSDFLQITKCYNYLQANAGREITFGELRKFSGWTEENLKTNISKRIREFLIDAYPAGIPIDDRKYKVNRNILNVDKERFTDLFRQKNHIFSNYELKQYPTVKIFDFYLPLTNENLLHQNLDELFYKDTLHRRLKAINLEELTPIYPKEETENIEVYYGRLTDLASDLFWGYSISHVSGRYRTGNQILTKEEAAKATGMTYLVDETTAVVKFIFPHEEGREEYHQKLDSLFKVLFVKAITEATPSEDEIWLLESIGNTTLNNYIKIS